MSIKKNKPNNNNKWLIITLAAVAVIVAAALTFLPQTDSLPATITVQQANEQFANGAYLLDVREPIEWNEAHVDGAVLIPLGELSARVDEIPTDKDVLIICRSGNRSAEARNLLRAAGLNRTTSINGGINAWISAGLPVISGP
ncbi:MAG: rhodanese-like domain-containing protein [Chloroflexi bacterium HGW-Chloroflexi-5]|jgi:rhodanese-related sulfurtransferase|nr:MAG: rhodanese-like domain-containing protein [Chloroflexi bacterium HGW-Chloroflexi-5]